tara:strand:- start:448 stop:810 length:363 start_codon:yes stop_codon:yes gene_type:complete
MSLNRLQKIISESSLLSRSTAGLVITKGIVKLNRRQAILREKEDPISDHILICGKVLPKKQNHKVILKVGRNRQIRRIGTLLGYPFQGLQRISIVNINSNGLEGGKWRELKTKEWIQIFD